MMSGNAEQDPRVRIANLKPGEPFMVGGLDWSWAFVVFKEIPGAPGYMVASDGRILSCWKKVWLSPKKGTKHVLSNEWKSLRGGTNRDGYLQLVLCFHGRRSTKLFHRLVMEAFVRPRPKGMVGCHNNGDRSLNAIWNLRWDTQKSNIADKVKHGTDQSGSRHPHAKLNEKIVRRIRRMRSRGITLSRIADRYGISSTTVSGIARKQAWTKVA